MAVRVMIPTPLRQYTAGKDWVEASGATVQEVLANLVAQYAALTDRLLDGGKLRRFVNLYVNDEDVRYLKNLDTPVQDGDELSIIPAVAGG
jgi:molybdopterin synthase sulfur carrier subunit